MGLFKKKIVKKTYDREHMKPVIIPVGLQCFKFATLAIMKNKIVVLLLAMSMTASIVGCGGNTSPSDAAISKTETEESSVVVETDEADHVEESDSVAGTLPEEDSEENATTNEDDEIVETDEGRGKTNEKYTDYFKLTKKKRKFTNPM